MNGLRGEIEQRHCTEFMLLRVCLSGKCRRNKIYWFMSNRSRITRLDRDGESGKRLPIDY